MRFNGLMIALAAIGAAASGAVAPRVGKLPGMSEQKLIPLAPDTWGMHRYSAPGPTGTLRTQRQARKRRNQLRHRRACRG